MAAFQVLVQSHRVHRVGSGSGDPVLPRPPRLRTTSRAPRDGRLIGRMTALDGVEIEIAYVNGPGHRIELIQYKAPADREVVGRACAMPAPPTSR